MGQAGGDHDTNRRHCLVGFKPDKDARRQSSDSEFRVADPHLLTRSFYKTTEHHGRPRQSQIDHHSGIIHCYLDPCLECGAHTPDIQPLLRRSNRKA